MSDRRAWLEEWCPFCRAAPGARCRQGRHSPAKHPSPVLHVARGWRERRCPTCKALPGDQCRTPSGREASQTHTARLDPARGELAGRGRCGRSSRAAARLARWWCSPAVPALAERPARSCSAVREARSLSSWSVGGLASWRWRCHLRSTPLPRAVCVLGVLEVLVSRPLLPAAGSVARARQARRALRSPRHRA